MTDRETPDLILTPDAIYLTEVDYEDADYPLVWASISKDSGGTEYIRADIYAAEIERLRATLTTSQSVSDMLSGVCDQKLEELRAATLRAEAMHRRAQKAEGLLARMHRYLAMWEHHEVQRGGRNVSRVRAAARATRSNSGASYELQSNILMPLLLEEGARISEQAAEIERLTRYRAEDKVKRQTLTRQIKRMAHVTAGRKKQLRGLNHKVAALEAEIARLRAACEQGRAEGLKDAARFIELAAEEMGKALEAEVKFWAGSYRRTATAIHALAQKGGE